MKKYIVEYAPINEKFVLNTNILSQKQFDRFVERFIKNDKFVLVRINKFNTKLNLVD